MSGEENDQRSRLAVEAERIRASGRLGRSDLLMRLFDFLVESSLAGRAAKEIEIGREVFSRGGDFEPLQDATVRVNVHRLRKKLREIYAGEPPEADRLIIPAGEYRLVLAENDASLADENLSEPPETKPRSHRWPIVVGLFAAMNVLAWALFLLLGSPRDEAIRAAGGDFWKPLHRARPTLIVTGDYYMFGEAPDTFQVSRLVRHFDINSRDDLDAYLMSHPSDVGRYVDVKLHYLPQSIGSALRNLVPVVNAAVPRGNRPQVIPQSQLIFPGIKTANIVYVGFLSGLGILRDPLFAASGFEVGRSYDELVDRKTAQRFSSDWSVVADGKMPSRDIGYIASLPGPTGNRVLIIAGTRDAAVMQMAAIAADRTQLDRLSARAGSQTFEALYQVRTLDNQDLGSDLAIARPLTVTDIWREQRSRENFPDQLQATVEAR